MSAVVCGKRSLFEDIHGSPPASKRGRCGGSPVHFSPSAPPLRTGSLGAVGAGSPQAYASTAEEKLGVLRNLFPDMEAQVVGRVLESCENNLDHAIISLTGLRLSSHVKTSSSQPSSSQPAVSEPGEMKLSQVEEGLPGPSGSTASPSQSRSECDPTVGSPQAEGMEWVELVVREMMAASDMNDARLRAGRVLEGFEKVVQDRGSTVMASLEKENMNLKEAVQALLKDNHILKRAVQIQHDRQQEQEEKLRELQRLKQVLVEYQEQVRALENSNYALSVHLRTAQGSNSMPGRFHPDIF